MPTNPAAMPGMIRLPTGMGFEVDSDDEDPDASTFVNESVMPTNMIAAALATSTKDGPKDIEESTQLTPPVLPPAPIVTPPKRISEPVPVQAPRVPPAQVARVEIEPAPLLPPPMVAPSYPSAAPYTQQQQQLAAGSSALKHEAVRTRALGEGSSITSPGMYRGETNDEPARRKLPLPLLLGGGAVAAVLLVVVIVLATRGGKSSNRSAKPEREHQSVKAVATGDKGSAREAGSAAEPQARDPEPMAATTPGSAKPPGKKPAAGSGSAAAVIEPGAGSASEATVASNPPTPIPSPPPAVGKRPVATLGGKKVVLEYDTTPKAPPKTTAAVTPAVVDENAVRTARNAYFNGNKRLFAGDADGALKLYQQALSVYPGYVAGYRGLGLAYAQKGDKKNALKAFRTYMNAVPTAKDIALIKQRVTTLQR